MLAVDVKRFGYRRGESQIQDVHIELRPGRTVILGPNGAGKSTLLKAVAGVVPFEGSLVLDGQAAETRRRRRPSAFRTGIGWLPQHVVPFGALTAREHVAYLGWLKGLSTKAAWDSALKSLVDVGLDSRANQKARELSGGQMRRLGIAGVLVHDAQYLLLDEPTAGLDPRERDRLVQVLESLENDRSVMVSTHDTASLIDVSAHIIVLVGGTVRFAGSCADFIGPFAGPPEAQLRQAYAQIVPED